MKVRTLAIARPGKGNKIALKYLTHDKDQKAPPPHQHRHQKSWVELTVLVLTRPDALPTEHAFVLLNRESASSAIEQRASTAEGAQQRVF